MICFLLLLLFLETGWGRPCVFLSGSFDLEDYLDTLHARGLPLPDLDVLYADLRARNCSGHGWKNLTECRVPICQLGHQENETFVVPSSWTDMYAMMQFDDTFNGSVYGEYVERLRQGNDTGQFLCMAYIRNRFGGLMQSLSANETSTADTFLKMVCGLVNSLVPGMAGRATTTPIERRYYDKNNWPFHTSRFVSLLSNRVLSSRCRRLVRGGLVDEAVYMGCPASAFTLSRPPREPSPPVNVTSSTYASRFLRATVSASTYSTLSLLRLRTEGYTGLYETWKTTVGDSLSQYWTNRIHIPVAFSSLYRDVVVMGRTMYQNWPNGTSSTDASAVLARRTAGGDGGDPILVTVDEDITPVCVYSCPNETYLSPFYFLSPACIWPSAANTHFTGRHRGVDRTSQRWFCPLADLLPKAWHDIKSIQYSHVLQGTPLEKTPDPTKALLPYGPNRDSVTFPNVSVLTRESASRFAPLPATGCSPYRQTLIFYYDSFLPVTVVKAILTSLLSWLTCRAYSPLWSIFVFHPESCVPFAGFGPGEGMCIFAVAIGTSVVSLLATLFACCCCVQCLILYKAAQREQPVAGPVEE